MKMDPQGYFSSYFGSCYKFKNLCKYFCFFYLHQYTCLFYYIYYKIISKKTSPTLPKLYILDTYSGVVLPGQSVDGDGLIVPKNP